MNRPLLLGALLLAAACGGPPDGPRVPEFDPSELPVEETFLAQVDRSMGRRDIFEVIRDPAFVGADDAHRVTPGELVIGLDLGDEQFAYPVRYLDAHEIVEHTAGGLDLLVCW